LPLSCHRQTACDDRKSVAKDPRRVRRLVSTHSCCLRQTKDPICPSCLSPAGWILQRLDNFQILLCFQMVTVHAELRSIVECQPGSNVRIVAFLPVATVNLSTKVLTVHRQSRPLASAEC